MADFSFLSRRRFLGAGLAAGSGLLMGGGALVWLDAPGAVAGIRCLSSREYRTLSHLALALFPAGGAFEAGAREADLARTFDAFLADEPPWNQADLKKALFLLEYGPILFERRLSTFSRLSEGERLLHFNGWLESSILLRRQVATAFQRFLALVFYDRPAVWSSIGYDGPLIRVEDPQ